MASAWAFTYSKQSYCRKPKGNEVAAYQRPSNYVQEALSIEEIATICGSGHAYRAATYKQGASSFKKANVESSCMIALDFDCCGHEPNEAIEFAENIGLPANFFYFSCSQKLSKNLYKSGRDYKLLYSPYPNRTKKRCKEADCKEGWNYRLCWILEEPVSAKDYEEAYKALLEAFSCFEPDKSTKDVSRLWFGGISGSYVLSDRPLPLAALGTVVYAYKVEQGTRKSNAIKAKSAFINELSEEAEPHSVNVDADWCDRLRFRCPLWDKWCSGEYLSYNERLSLWSNLRYLRYNGKSARIKRDVLERCDWAAYEGHTFTADELNDKFRDKNLKPLAIVKSHGEKTTVPQFFASGDAVVAPDVPKVPREELDRWMDEHVPAFLNDATPNMQILKSQTASGKTERIIDYLLSLDLDSKKVVYAAPTHVLLDEFQERLKAKSGFHDEALLKVNRVPPREVTKKDLMRFQVGLSAVSRDKFRSQAIKNLLDPDCKGIHLITHSLATSLSCLGNAAIDLLIIDEQIDSALVRENTVTLAQMATAVPFLDKPTQSDYLEFMNRLRDMERERDGIDVDASVLRYEVLPQLEACIDEYLASVETGLVPLGLFSAYRAKVKMFDPKGKPNVLRLSVKSPLVGEMERSKTPVRVFTATDLKTKTEALFKVQIPVVKAPLAVNTGRIIQYRGLSGSKGIGTKRIKDLAAYVKTKLTPEQVATYPVLSFKSCIDELRNQGFLVPQTSDGTDLHLKNCAGLDLLKGRSIIVIGKYDVPPDSYRAYADDLGITNLRMQNQRVKLNGVVQTLYLYEDETLRQQQLDTINEAAEQACGRARALREEGATVYLFADYVIENADEVRD